MFLLSSKGWMKRNQYIGQLGLQLIAEDVESDEEFSIVEFKALKMHSPKIRRRLRISRTSKRQR